MKCIFTKTLNAPKLPKCMNELNILSFPEASLSMVEQQLFNPIDYTEDAVITNSPFIASCFRKEDVLIHVADDGTHGDDYFMPSFETYGAGFDVLLKQLNNIKTLLPQVVVDEMRLHLNGDDTTALEYMETLGSSMERAYLTRKLQPTDK